MSPPIAPTPNERVKKLLRALERYTKTDLTYLASGGFWLTLDQIAGGIAAFLLAIAFAHFVPKDAYGTYRYLLAAFWVLTAFTFTGLPLAVGQAVARGKEGVYRASLRASLFWGLPLSLIAVGTGIYYFTHDNAIIALGFLVIAVFGPLVQTTSLFGTFLVGKKRFRDYALAGIVFAMVPAFVILGTMTINHSPLALLIAYFAGTVGIGAALTAYTFYRHRPNRELEPSFKSLGAHFSAMNLLSTIAGQIDKLVVFHYLGAIDLAVYAFATALPDQIRNVFSGFSTLAMPKFVTRPFGEIRANFWNRLLLFTAVLAVVTAAYIVVAPVLFDLFFPAYREAVVYSRVYALALIFIGGAFPITLLQAREAKRELYILNIVSPVFQILLLVFLTSLYGLMGAVVARIIGRMWGFLASGVLLESYARRARAA